jgi:hypothetical protein
MESLKRSGVSMISRPGRPPYRPALVRHPFNTDTSYGTESFCYTIKHAEMTAHHISIFLNFRKIQVLCFVPTVVASRRGMLSRISISGRDLFTLETAQKFGLPHRLLVRPIVKAGKVRLSGRAQHLKCVEIRVTI